jgi:hypothetical protein
LHQIRWLKHEEPKYETLACDGSDYFGKCFTEIKEFDNTYGNWFSCSQCEFNICENCLKIAALIEYISIIED